MKERNVMLHQMQLYKIESTEIRGYWRFLIHQGVVSHHTTSNVPSGSHVVKTTAKYSCIHPLRLCKQDRTSTMIRYDRHITPRTLRRLPSLADMEEGGALSNGITTGEVV